MNENKSNLVLIIKTPDTFIMCPAHLRIPTCILLNSHNSPMGQEQLSFPHYRGGNWAPNVSLVQAPVSE